MQPRRSHLTAAEIIKNAQRPLYYLLVQSREIRTEKDFRPAVLAQGYTSIQVFQPKARRKRNASYSVSTAVPGVGEFTHYEDGAGDRDGDEFLYLFLHRLDAEFYLDQQERKNGCALRGMKYAIRQTVGDVRFEQRFSHHLAVQPDGSIFGQPEALIAKNLRKLSPKP